MANSKLGLLVSDPKEFFRRAIERVTDRLLVLVSPTARRHSEVGPVLGWRQTRDVQLDYLKEHELRAEHTLLDLGCGTLRGGVPIIRYLNDGHYVGVEARAEVVEMAKQELRDEKLEHKNPEILHSANLATLDVGRKFDFIWAHSVLIHMTDEILDGCLRCAAAHLDPRGVFYANVDIGERADSTWKEFPVATRPHEFYAERAARNGLRVEAVGPWRTGKHTMLRFQLVG